MNRMLRSTSEHAALADPWQQQRQEARFALLLGALSIAALLYYYLNNELLLYGDAVAHLNIARRVVDNRHPLDSLSQLGTVWLPLQHIAMLPFVWSMALWRSGIAGAIPGMVAYALGALGILRLVNGWAPKLVAYVAAAIYALNPNLLYLQSTAMNEPIFLAFFVWSLVYLDEFLRAIFPPESTSSVRPALMKPERALEWCGITIAGGVFTRYDGWFVGAIFGAIVLAAIGLWWRTPDDSGKGRIALAPGPRRAAIAKSLIECLLLNALVVAFWLIYTRNVSGYALDFLNGPYSAKAIALRNPGAPPYPGQHHILTAGLYFLKAAKLNVGTGLRGELLFVLAVAGTAVALVRFRRCGVLLLLWLPLPFYALSIAFGSVPIYVPVWYPFSYYNVRYGLELLPVFAVFVPLAIFAVAERVSSRNLKIATWCVLMAVVGGSYLSIIWEGPITLREAQINSRGRISIEGALAHYLGEVPGSATLLMYEAEHVGALQRAGIRLRRVISEGNHPDWEWALLDPVHYADYIVACEGDPVWAAVRHRSVEFVQVISISAPGQSRCTIYKRGGL